MKRVSFKVAKALKEAGYNFTHAPSSFFTNETNSWFDNEDGELYSLPFVLEIWLWLSQVKKIRIDIIDTEFNIYIQGRFIAGCADSPEEAIIAAVNHLVINNLIK